MGGRQPGVEGEHRHLDGKGQKEGQENPGLEGRRVRLAHQCRDGESVRRTVQVQGDDGNRQQDRAGQGVDEELERGVDLARPAPDADQQEHGDQHGFPEDEEEDEVQGQNTPTMAVSMIRMQAKNSLTRVWM